MERNQRLIRFLITGALMLLLFQTVDGLGSWLGFDRQVTPNAEAQQIPTLSGEELTQKLAQSRQPTLLFIYASWCPYCRKQWPVMERLSRDYQGKLSIIPVAIDKNPNKLAGYLSANPSDLMSYRVPEKDYNGFRRTLADIGSDFTGSIPHSLLVDANGKLIDEVAGYLGYEDFTSGIEQTLR